MTTATTAAPDFTSIKARQQATWASGDFSVVAARIQLVAELLAESAGLVAGTRVLDVATGSGNAALAAARRGTRVVGVDYVPALLAKGRERARIEHLDVEFREGDAEELPCESGAFDTVLSVFGVMFAPNHAKAASELVRVCRPGGTIALASWTPDGYIGEMFRLVGRFIPPAAGLTPPVSWGNRLHLHGLFGDKATRMHSVVRTAVFHYPSAEENVEFFRTYYGPTLKTFANIDPARRDELAREMAELAKKFDARGGRGGPVAIEAEYLETVITVA